MGDRFGIRLTDREIDIVERGMGRGEHNRSARVRELIRLGGAVESAMDSSQVPAGRREPGDIDLFVRQGVKKLREADAL